MMRLATLMGLRGGGGNGVGRYLPTPGIGPAPMSSLFMQDVLRLFDRGEPMQQRYQRYWNYYTNDQYTREAINDRAKEAAASGGRDFSAQLQLLYSFTRAFYNPVAETVDMDVDTVFREPTRVSAKQAGKNDALDLILRRSRFAERRMDIVRYGAATGDVYLRVDEYDGDIKLCVHSPDTIRVITSPHDQDRVEYAVISYNYTDYSGAQTAEHNRTDIIYPDVIRTFLDGVAYGFDGAPAVRNNPLGVVPVVHIKNLNIDLRFGLPTYHNVVPTLDAINEVLSFMMNIVKINADPTIIAEGIRAGDLVKGNTADPTSTNVWYVPSPRDTAAAKPHVYMLEWKGNLPDVLGMMRDARNDVVDALPEMHITKMQQQGAYSGFALNAMLFAFVSKATRMRIGYGEGVRRALSMCMAAQEMIDGKTAEYDPLDPAYDVEIALPQVLPVDEAAAVNQVVSKLEAGLIGREDALKELGYPQDEWAEILKRADEYTKTKTDAAIAIKGPGPQGPSNASKSANAGVNGQPLGKQNAANGKAT
jgi:hypothetical protein